MFCNSVQSFKVRMSIRRSLKRVDQYDFIKRNENLCFWVDMIAISQTGVVKNPYLERVKRIRSCISFSDVSKWSDVDGSGVYDSRFVVLLILDAVDVIKRGVVALFPGLFNAAAGERPDNAVGCCWGDVSTFKDRLLNSNDLMTWYMSWDKIYLWMSNVILLYLKCEY